MKAKRFFARWSTLFVWSSAITVFLYGSALSLPFFLDDFVQFPWVDGHNLFDIWRTAEGLVYYRPLAFTIWKITYLLLGQHSAFAQHALNLILHALNGFMLAWLASRLLRKSDWRFLYLSATLFLFYPFSYQAVPWIGSVMHILVTTLILYSIAFYLRMRDTKKRIWGAFSLLFTLLAPFAHENGVLIVPLIAIIEFTRAARDEPLAHTLCRVALWLVPLGVWLPLWLFAPHISADSLALNNAETLMQNSVFFAQGIAYPFTWIGGWLRDARAINDLLAAASLSFLGLGLAAVIQWRTGFTRRDLLPWLWCIVTVAPAIAVLAFRYVTDGPRLLMLAAVGTSWLWADVFLRVSDRWSIRIAQRGLPNPDRAKILRPGTIIAMLATLALLIQNYVFIRDRIHMHEIGGTFIQQAVDYSIDANTAGQTAVFINLPAWISPLESTYAIGHEGVKLFPGFAPDDTLVSVNSGQPADVAIFTYEPIRSEIPYFYGLHGEPINWSTLKNNGQIFLARYVPEPARIEPAGALSPITNVVEPVARFDSFVTLLDAHATLNQNTLRIDLIWRVDEPPPPHVTTFVHVFDANGQLIAQADGDPLAGSYPFFLWDAGTTIKDTRWAQVDVSNIAVRVGLYDRLGGDRLSATKSNGAAWPEQSVNIPFTQITPVPDQR